MTKAKLHSEIQSGLIHVASGDLSVEKCREVIDSMIDQYALQIAEKAVGDEKKFHVTHPIDESDRIVIVTADKILSRIKTEIRAAE